MLDVVMLDPIDFYSSVVLLDYPSVIVVSSKEDYFYLFYFFYGSKQCFLDPNDCHCMYNTSVKYLFFSFFHSQNVWQECMPYIMRISDDVSWMYTFCYASRFTWSGDFRGHMTECEFCLHRLWENLTVYS